MPVYTFRCNECEKTFDEITIRAEWDKIRCRRCGGKVEKIMTPANFIIKGFNAKNGYSK